MKKILLATLCATLQLAASAQTKLYICDKFDSDSYDLSDAEFEFNDDKTEFTIDDDTYEVEDIDSIVFTKPTFPCVRVTWDGDDATISIDSSISGVTYSKSGGHVTITSTNTTDEILYVLEGSSSDGSLVINGSYKLTIHLNGLTLHSTKGGAIEITSGKRIAMKLLKGTVNTLSDCSNGEQKAAFYTKGHLEIKGKGTLNVTGNTKHALQAREYLKIKASTGEINILGAVNDGIHCGKGSFYADDAEHCQFIMNGGTVNISNCGSDCIDSDDYSSMFINGGTLTMDISQEDGCGLKCDSCLYMTGGDITFTIPSTGLDSHGIRSGCTGYYNGGTITGTVAANGSKGVRARKNTSSTTVYSATLSGDLYFNGTDVNLTVSGGKNTSTSSNCWGVRADKNLYQTDGDITVTVENSEAVGISVSGTNSKTGGTQTVN